MSAPHKSKSNFDRLSDRIKRYPSEGRLMLLRNLAFGAAAVCLVIFVQIIQVGAASLPLKVCVLAAAIGMPLWLAVGGCYEYYIFLGAKSYSHFRNGKGYEFLGAIASIAGVSLLITIGSALYYLVPEAVYVFAAGIGIGFVVMLGFHAHIARWWYGSAGPGEHDVDI